MFLGSLFQDFPLSYKAQNFSCLHSPFSFLALLLLYIYLPVLPIAFNLHAIGWVLFYFVLAHTISWFLCNFWLLFSVVLVWSLTIKVKNYDYFGVFFVNQDYFSFSCNYSRIVCKWCTNYNHIVSSLHQSYN